MTVSQESFKGNRVLREYLRHLFRLSFPLKAMCDEQMTLQRVILIHKKYQEAVPEAGTLSLLVLKQQKYTLPEEVPIATLVADIAEHSDL
jgi:hypothetical protein